MSRHSSQRIVAEWHATRVTCEPYSCSSRFSRQSRPSRLSKESAIAAEVFVNNAGQAAFQTVLEISTQNALFTLPELVNWLQP